ncbi:MAG TPA: histone deacetylase [Acidimicrobiia bacterium]
MRLVVASHPVFHDHATGEGHPERPERVSAVMRGLEGSGLEMVRMEAPAIDRADLTRVHDSDYVEFVEGFCKVGGGWLDYDTVASPESWDAALRSAGAVALLVDELRGRSDAAGFAVTRPPGHHALRSRAMGFCLFNNVAVAAARIRARGETVAVVDWDVHHGNGTQEAFIEDEGVLYVSLHQWPLYPHEGAVSDIDEGAPGTTINIPFLPGTGGGAYRMAFDEVVMPVMERFGPDWVLVSAGYDGHVDDPLADMSLTASDYGWMASRLTSVFPPERVVVALEGGYDLTALEQGVAATVRGLAGDLPDDDSVPSVEDPTPTLERVLAAVRRYWSI